MKYYAKVNICLIAIIDDVEPRNCQFFLTITIHNILLRLMNLSANKTCHFSFGAYIEPRTMRETYILIIIASSIRRLLASSCCSVFIRSNPIRMHAQRWKISHKTTKQKSILEIRINARKFKQKGEKEGNGRRKRIKAQTSLKYSLSLSLLIIILVTLHSIEMFSLPFPPSLPPSLSFHILFFLKMFSNKNFFHVLG